MSKLEIVELDNGLKVYLINDNTKHTTYMNLIVKYGGIDNEFIFDNKKYKIKNGMAHFIEHLVLESSVYGDLMEMFGRMGIRSNGITSIDKTQYYLDTVDHIYDSLKVLIKGIHNTVITDDIIHNIKLPILEEKRRSLDNKYSVLYNKGISNIMDNKKFNTVLGDLKEIDSININKVKLCLEAFYRPSNEIIVIGGRFDRNEILDTIKSTYNSLKFNDKELIKVREKHRKKVNSKKSVLKVNTGIGRTLVTLKLDTIDMTPLEKLKLDLYLFCYLRMNFGIMSKMYKTMLEDGIVNGGIGFSNNMLEGYHVVRIEADTKESRLFTNRILNYLGDKKYVFDEELFNLYKRNYIIDLITRTDSIYDMVDPLIDNIISYDYHELDSIEVWNSLDFKEFKKYIKLLNFNNYSIVELKQV